MRIEGQNIEAVFGAKQMAAELSVDLFHFFSTFETELAGVDVNYLSCSREKLCMPLPVNRVAKREKRE